MRMMNGVRVKKWKRKGIHKQYSLHMIKELIGSDSSLKSAPMFSLWQSLVRRPLRVL
jgi:hypothetical protein